MYQVLVKVHHQISDISEEKQMSEPSNSSLNFNGSVKFVPQLCEIST